MCGRVRCTLRADDFPRACGINPSSTRSVQRDRYRPRFNVSPGSYMPVVRRENGNCQGTILHCMKWGLIPSFTNKTHKPDHYKMFNARSESIREKASFRRLVPNNRCLVIVEGFYEWKKIGSKKQPYYLHFKNGQPFVFAALYDSWEHLEGETLYTFTILTTSCSPALQWLHDRMPVILGNKSSIDEWLNGSCSSKFSTLFKPYEDSDLAWYPVTPAMGKPSFEGPECIVEVPLKDVEKNLISKFFLKKGVDKEQDSRPQIKSIEYVHEEPHESLKEGEETSTVVTVSEDDGNSKSENSTHGEAEKRSLKRDYEEVCADNVEKMGVINSGKGNLKNAGQKQPTLLSYFGRR